MTFWQPLRYTDDLANSHINLFASDKNVEESFGRVCKIRARSVVITLISRILFLFSLWLDDILKTWTFTQALKIGRVRRVLV